MQSSQIYEIGKKAYNGNQQARKKWFQKLSEIAKMVGQKYNICPSLILCKASIQSGWGTDLYEERTLEPRFQVKMQRKAQKFNNLMGMNAFELNCKYLAELPQTEWSKYQTTFRDYGPHIHDNQYVLTPDEPWKAFISIQDCFQDWAANVRFQAECHKKEWGNSIRQQLLAIESYTPQGAVAASKGMHFKWQDDILKLYETFELWKYDQEVIINNMAQVRLTIANLDQHIKKAYEYANKFCQYGPTDRVFPPMEDKNADCVGLVLRALYTMGYNNSRKNINNILSLCESLGMVKSTDINDVWKHHGIVCMQDKSNAGSLNVGHVYYSLGGTSIKNINKYDLGSNQRIDAAQPFPNVPVNEWPDRRIFMCFYYIKEAAPVKKKPAFPKYETNIWTKGEIKKRVGIYAGPGSAWEKLGILEIGTLVDFGPRFTNSAGNDWRRVRYYYKDKLQYDGYVFHSSVGTISTFTTYKSKIKKLGKNDFAALRMGPGTNFDKIDQLKSGCELTIKNCTINNNQKWYYVIVDQTKKKGFVSSVLIEGK